MKKFTITCLLILSVISACKSSVEPSTVETEPEDEPQDFPVYDGGDMQFIENEFIRVGIDLNVGGAITYVADKSNNINIINNNP